MDLKTNLHMELRSKNPNHTRSWPAAIAAAAPTAAMAQMHLCYGNSNSWTLCKLPAASNKPVFLEQQTAGGRACQTLSATCQAILTNEKSSCGKTANKSGRTSACEKNTNRMPRHENSHQGYHNHGRHTDSSAVTLRLWLQSVFTLNGSNQEASSSSSSSSSSSQPNRARARKIPHQLLHVTISLTL